jgi:uncharacterized protein YkwD
LACKPAKALPRGKCSALLALAALLGLLAFGGQTAPLSAPGAEDAEEVARRVLELTNRARSAARRCGNGTFAATHPLAASPALTKAARDHARDMATHGYFAHRGRDGSTVGQRAARTGYRWRAIGENIAAGPPTAEAVVQGWLNSPEHCANLMRPHFTDMGTAFAVSMESKHGTYWVQVFGAPR